MSKRIFMNGVDPNFQFFFGQPYFQGANLRQHDLIHKENNIDNEDNDEINSKQDTLLDADEENDSDLETKNLVKINEKYASSLSSDRLKIDPNYKWLLKDLNLNNDTRMIDVTDILLEENNEKLNESLKEQKLDEEEKQVQEDKEMKEKFLKTGESNVQGSLNNTSKDLEAETMNIQDPKSEEKEHYEEEDEVNNSNEYDEDHRNDHNFISKLYEKLIKPVYSNESLNKHEESVEDSNESEIDLANKTGEFKNQAYKEWSNENKKNSKFSKSFEVSIESMDNLIDRVDNGIKLKRGKSSPESKKPQENNGHEQLKIVESLKQEWSCMFNKLENDYKSKLDEQQKLNDLKLKSLHEEIQKCIKEQAKFMNNQQQSHKEAEDTLKQTNSNLKSTITIESTDNLQSCHKPTFVDASTTTIQELVNPNSIVDNAKYISNLRMELKTKHARHIQDLKDYYEKELEDFKKRLHFYEMKYGNTNDLDNEPCYKTKYDQLVEVNNDLKETNQVLINKINESNEHINFLKHENFELTNTLSQLDIKVKYSNEKIHELEDAYSNLESQMSESIKIQDKYVRELQLEKRNLVKKTQDNEDLQMNIKYFEQKCEDYELKLEEKDNLIARLKTKLTQTETDLNRLDYEYQKLKTLKQQNLTQQPYIIASTNSQTNLSQNQTQSIPIRTQRHSSIPSFTNIVSPSNSNQNGTLLQSPNKQQQLTILCNSTSQINNNTNNAGINNQFSSSSSSSKSPIAARSRSPSITKNSNKSLNNNLNEENLLKYQNHLKLHHQQQQQQQQHQQQQQQQQQINEDSTVHTTYRTYNYVQTKYTNQSPSTINTSNQSNNFKLNSLTPDKQIKYIEQLEHEFDLLMSQKQQLEAKLTRLPFKANNPTKNTIREAVEDELNYVEKKLSSVKLEMRKLNIIKTH